MTFVCKAALLLLAVLGYGALYKRSKLPTCFFPVTLVSGISTALYAFGFFSALKIGSYAILLGGLALLVLCRKHLKLREFFSDWSILFCLAAGVWLYVITRGATLSHWDDGSHWYRICKSIYVEGAFPTTPDIMYYNYVPGCQLWVYFVLRFIDFSTANCMFAQGLINIACVATLFAGMRGAKTRTEKCFFLAMIAAAGVTLCAMDIGTYALLVDLQLGLTAMALLILLLDQGGERGVLIPAALVFTFLLLVKNSAVFFAGMIFLWAIIRHRWRGKQLVKNAVGLVGIPMLLRAAYTVRAGIVYAGAAASPQMMSLERFLQMLALKDADTLRLFTGRFLSKLIIGDTGQVAAVYISIVLLALLVLCLRSEKKYEAAYQIRQSLVMGLVMLFAYVVMLYCTYLFTMTVNETTSVNGFYRYYGSMVIVFAGMTVYMSMANAARVRLGGEGTPRIYALGMLLFAVLAMPGAYSKRYIWGQDKFFMPDPYGTSFWYTMEYNLPESRNYSDAEYVVLWDADDFSDSVLYKQGVEYNVGAWLRADHVIAISADDLKRGMTQEQVNALHACDRLVFMSDMSDERELLSPYITTSDLSVGLRGK